MPTPLSRLPLVVLLTTLAFPIAARQLAAEVPTPEAHFGFRMGADGQLATADGIESEFGNGPRDPARFLVQHRAQSLASLRLLFNAILTAK